MKFPFNMFLSKSIHYNAEITNGKLANIVELNNVLDESSMVFAFSLPIFCYID